MTNLRIGHGYDVHRLTERRRLVLGGVEIPWDRGLLGHSDADVLTHAVMDALCGAAKLGDIGKLFPDSDPRYAGISSLELLRQVAALLQERGWAVVNIDATLIAQAPRWALPPGDGGEPLRSSWDGCGPGECEGHHRGASGLYRGRLRYGGPCGGAAGTAPLKKGRASGASFSHVRASRP